ncbi:hypothetical protein B9Z55_007436 [Caenorhabditis nigoni]|nr:hypothetical protein B9Z55_007436 [Caenorhabditis nigoni]
MQYLYSPAEEHFGLKWQIKLKRKDQHLGMFLYADVDNNEEVHTYRAQKLISKNKEITCSNSGTRVFKTSAVDWGWNKFIEWQTLENQYLNDGKLEAEIYFLSSQSPYFAALFLGQFEESGKPEIELKNINPRDLQYYLEVLYGEPGIDEETVEGILTIADMYDTPIAVKKCKTFLMKHEDLRLKLKMAGKFRLEELKKSCMDQLKSKEDIRSVIPENPNDMDYEILVELLKKSLDLEK